MAYNDEYSFKRETQDERLFGLGVFMTEACLAFLDSASPDPDDRRPETPGARATPNDHGSRSAHHPLRRAALTRRDATPRCAAVLPRSRATLLPTATATPPLLLRCYRTVSHHHGCYVYADGGEQRGKSCLAFPPVTKSKLSYKRDPRAESDERPGTEPRPSKPPRPAPAPRFVIRVRNTEPHVHSTSARTAERRPRRRRRGGTGRGSEEARVSSSLDSRSVGPPSRSWRSSYSSHKADSYVIANTDSRL